MSRPAAARVPSEDGDEGDKGKGRDRAAAAAASAPAAAAREAIDYADREGIAGRVLREWLLRGDRHIQGKTLSLSPSREAALL